MSSRLDHLWRDFNFIAGRASRLRSSGRDKRIPTNRLPVCQVHSCPSSSLPEFIGLVFPDSAAFSLRRAGTESNGRSGSNPALENSEPDFGNGPEGGVRERPEWIDGKIQTETRPVSIEPFQAGRDRLNPLSCRTVTRTD